jgi:uncharacterized protein YaaQ
MNIQIKELAEQAGFIGNGFQNTVVGTSHETALKNFAELIAQECAELCDRFQARDVGMQPAECAGAIRNMFGVKQ